MDSLLNIFSYLKRLLQAADLVPDLVSARGIFCCIALLASVLAVLIAIVSFFSDFFGDADAGGDTPDGETGPFSVRAVIAFLLGLGWGGFISVQNGLSTGMAIFVGLFIGAVLAVLITGIMRIMYGLRVDGTLRYEELVGKRGTVYVSIPPHGEPGGQVQIPHPSQFITMSAVQFGDDPLPAQTTIVVTEANSSLLTVEPLKPSPTK